MQTQQMDCWCWLAVGTSIALYYDQDSGWTQCECLNLTDPQLHSICCDGKEALKKAKCDVTGFLVNREVTKGSFITTGLAVPGDTSTFTEGLFSFEQIRECIDRGQPMAVNIITNEKHEYPNGAIGTFAHFIAIIGYEVVNGTEYVYLADPMYLDQDDVNENLMTYENLKSSYDLITYPASVAYSFHTTDKVKSA